MPKGHTELGEVQKKKSLLVVSENGERVPDLAREFSVHSKTIYNLLGRQANKAGALIELAKIKREMVIVQPNQAWFSDFTYLSYRSKFMYLATILDAFTREVIAWNIRVRHNADLVCEALISALNKREKSPNIFHSDQGSEYRSSDLAEILRAKNIQSSMSSKGSPWQNGRQ